MFRFKKSVPVSYDRQGYIFFLSRLYEQLPEDKRRMIDELCIQTGGEHSQALFMFVTTDISATAICQRCYISHSTLERVVRRYYMEFPKEI